MKIKEKYIMNQSGKRAKKQSAKRKLSDNLLALYFLDTTRTKPGNVGILDPSYDKY